MLETGDFIQIRFQHEARNQKPIDFNRLQAASVALFSAPGSTAILPDRPPSALPATIAVLFTSVLGAALLSSRGAGFVAGVVMASALGLVVEANLAKTDAALLAAVVAVQFALGIMYVRGASATRCIGGWWSPSGPPRLWGSFERTGCAGFGSHYRGDTVDRRPRHSLDQTTAADPRPRPDNADGDSLVRRDRTSYGGTFSCGVALAGSAKLVGAQESHGAPPGSYLLLSLANFWPGSLFLVPAGFWGWRQRRAPAHRFLIAWLLPAWILCELMPTELPHYVLPLYPALALLAGGVLQDLPQPLTGHMRRLEGIVTVVWGAISITLAGALVALLMCFGAGVSLSVIIAAVVLLGLALLLLLYRRRPSSPPLWSECSRQGSRCQRLVWSCLHSICCG
jgi:4-amino-4-deoxy-L-arabinose transferase-like glycosyltransferase